MLTRIVFVILITLQPVLILSQIKHQSSANHEPGVWSISYNAGFGMDYENSTGHKLSFEAGYSEDNSKAFLFNISSAKLYKSRDSYYSLYECSVGPRIYVLKNQLVYLEGNIGAQINSFNTRYYYWDMGLDENYYSTNSRAAFYIAAGIGSKVMISANNAFLFRLKYNTTMPSTEGYTYINAQFGLEFNTSENKSTGKLKEKNFILSLGGGIISPQDIAGRKYNGNGVILIEGAVPTNFNGEIYGETVYNRIRSLRNSNLNSIVSFNIGPRFFINKNMLSSFLEFGGGMYILAESNSDKDDIVHPGLSIGTGFTAGISKLFELFAKGKIHFIFTDNPSFPPYSTLSGGMRFNL